MSVRICAFAIICIAAATVIKHIRPDFVPFLRIGATVLIGALAVSVISPFIKYIESLFGTVGFGEWGGSVLKALGVAVLVQISADICRDCGENSLASGVELIGKLEIIILCLPMMEKIISTAKEVLAW